MELINFRLSGRFAHFLRAEASASALSYPVPPRTVILGILGAVLGLSKDKAPDYPGAGKYCAFWETAKNLLAQDKTA